MKNRIVKGVLLLLLAFVATACEKFFDDTTEDEQYQEIIENAQQVMTDVSAIFETADSISDMSLYLDEIKAMDYVEDAWQEECSIGVKIKNGGIITWNYFDNDTTEYDMDTSSLGELGDNWAKGDYTIGICEKKTACISISKVKYSKKTVNTIKKYLTDKDYSVSIVSGEYFSPHFICNSIPNYGVNIIIAHGTYNAETGIHRIISGVEYKEENFKKIFSDWIDNGLEIAGVKEVKNGRNINVYYLAVTERLMKKKMTKEFPKNSLMFASVCSTLEGNNSMSKFLVQNKKLGCYLGYDGAVSSKRGEDEDLKKIMEYMLNGGYTVRTAHAMVGPGTNPQLSLVIPTTRDVALVGCNCNENEDWVDLGLPSGLLWATRNVGASSPTDYGNYYAWGETSPKSAYYWSNYQYCVYNEDNGDYGYNSFTKYCNSSSYGYNGFTDNLTTLQPSDDAATANYGGRMPTKEEWQELLNNTTSTWITINGVNGRCFTGSNGNSLFLPAAGYRYNSVLDDAGSYGSYWSSSLNTDSPCVAWRMGFYSYEADYWYSYYRENGRSVRAVRQNRPLLRSRTTGMGKVITFYPV